MKLKRLKTKQSILTSFCTIILLFSFTDSSAQILKKFRLGVDFGLIFPHGKTDVIVGSEIKYTISDKLKIGARIEGAGLAKKIKNAEGNYITGSSRLNLNYTATAQYYLFETEKLFPFIEAGFGYYELADISSDIVNNYSRDIIWEDKPFSFDPTWGGMLKTGIEYDQVRLSFSYHFMPNSKVVINAIDQNISNNYFTFSIGYFIGK
ncbi:hypothetical protein [Aureivirga sp. CE67]|uniref:hypothetical protein n=1 Tax=Aureivirga sp. CE67 TaxID=1788983 RepID=UPI0018C900F5|nr:hypothetical protein [Aureivirga sp. CE67]